MSDTPLLETPLLDKWKYFLKDYESPDRFIEWAYYSLISASLQRRVWLDEEPRQCFPNMYILLIGPPATGKSLTIAAVGELLRHGMLHEVNPITKQLQPKIPVAPDSTTLEALTQALSKEHQRRHPYTGPDGKDLAYVHCSLQFLAEELGVLLKKHTEDMVNVLIQGYDARQLERKTKNSGNDIVKNICLGMLGGTTPTFMRNAFDERLIGEGFSSRFVMLYESGPRFLREHPGFSAEQRLGWTDIFMHLAKRTTVEFGPCRLTPEAAEWRKQYYESGQLQLTRLNHDISLDHYYSRKNFLWKKLSIILHFSEAYEGRDIGLPTVLRALNVLNAAEKNMHLAFTSIARNQLYNIQQQLLRTIEQHTPTGGIHHMNLFRQFTKDVDAQQFNDCIATLLATGQIINKSSVYTAVKKNNNPNNTN